MKSQKSNYTLRGQVMKSMKDIAYEAISSGILSGEIPAGDRLVEADLSRQLNISRGPIREALLRLEREGLVCSYPYKGCVVAELSENEIRNVYVPIRRIIERFAFYKAFDVLSEDDYEQLIEVVDALAEACEKKDAELVAMLDSEFHEMVVSKCVSPTLRVIWKSLSTRVAIIINQQTRLCAEITSRIAKEHYDLIDCFKARDVARLEQLLEEHIK